MANVPLSNIDFYHKHDTPDPQTGNLRAFLSQLFQDSEAQYASFSFTLDAIDPLAYLEMCWNQDQFQFYWEKPTDELAIAAGGSVKHLSAEGSGRFNAVSKAIQTTQQLSREYSSVPHPYSGMMFLGGFSFFNNISDGVWNDFDPASFTIPEWTIIQDGKFNLVTFSVELSLFETARDLHQHLIDRFDAIRKSCRMDKKLNGQETPPSFTQDISLSDIKNGEYEQWTSTVTKATDLIADNNFDKIVIARKISIPRRDNTPPTQVLNSLRKRYQNCSSFLLHQGGSTFLGSSPERLGSFRSRLFLTEALAGSIHRGQTESEDTQLGQHLAKSKKDQSEHNFVIKDIEERLIPFAIDFYRSPKPEIKKLTNVQHLYTPIRAHLEEEAEVLNVIGQLHPTPAVGGYPWKDAAPYLDELENFNRGWYASPIGWINSKGMGEFAVGIRSGLLTQKEAHFFAGCGIVADSNPAHEWEETNLKLKPMLSALHYD
ncbi:isochorismate synthase [Fodinibius halophilus]|uniref:isochorismate synthase n=1 Tax=Fodinibius halophilus TaxID=1736908 RepID=A0A6M1SYX4_9BACT|nr:isochorismate synthase [Fodinibius halophilus]NGP86857.1 isochorismate synthase [Fodinibius halophilus]